MEIRLSLVSRLRIAVLHPWSSYSAVSQGSLHFKEEGRKETRVGTWAFLCSLVSVFTCLHNVSAYRGHLRENSSLGYPSHTRVDLIWT